MKTAAQLKADIRADVWASGEPENLIVAHDNHFQEAFADICKWVDCEQQNNANLVRFCKTNYKSGMTVLPAPAGRIFRVFTVANDDFSDPVFYRQTPWPEPESWARNLFLFPKPLVTDARKLPMGFDYANAANDSLYGRARTGIWSIWKGNIYLAPWIQSNELVVIEWDGVKDKWEDGDPINPSILYRKAVKLFTQFAHERDYGEPARANLFSNAGYQGYYDIALGDLIHECRLQTKVRIDLSSTAIERNRLCAELTDDAIIVDADGVTIGDLGNVSVPGTDLDNIIRLVTSWGPDAITACEFVAGTVADYDLTAGNSLHDFLKPYIGKKGAGGSVNGLWVAPAAADYTLDATLAKLKAFFPIPGGLGYYDEVIGDVHLLVIDTSASQADGITSGSTQGAWLEGKLATSTAPWKVVKLQNQPYGSVHSNVGLQWPFQAWGAHLVVSSQSKNYERLSVSGMPFINNGLGGKVSIEPVVTPDANTVFAYAAGFGAGKITATTKALVYEFFASDGTLIDTLTLTK